MLLLALVVAGQLTLHQHALIPEHGGAGPLACAVCAFDADRIRIETPLFSDALGFIGFLVGIPEPSGAAVILFTSGVRGPPVSIG